MGMRRGRTNKNPPVFSHEFFIQNHADIMSCVAMVFVIGLMFQATSPVASMFVAMQHNETVNGTEGAEPMTMYTCGLKDIFSVSFYFLICIVVHAVVQEYVLDKLNRKMHLSKVKHSMFNESGQLLVFYLASAIWGIDTIIRENLFNISQLWEGYPHAYSSATYLQQPHLGRPNIGCCKEVAVVDRFILKFYFIIQMAYWIHTFPELYFQKVKKEEMQGRIRYAVLYLVYITAAWALNFTRVALFMLILHYIIEFVFHLARLFYFSEKNEIAGHCFMVFNVLFVLVRLGTITLAVLTFWYGLKQSSQTAIDFATGNFNTEIIRIICLAGVCMLQAWMMWNFITFHLKRIREKTVSTRKPKSPSKKRSKVVDEDIRDLPEVDQNTAQNGSALRPRKAKK